MKARKGKKIKVSDYDREEWQAAVALIRWFISQDISPPQGVRICRLITEIQEMYGLGQAFLDEKFK
jgi:hypothetical protein